MAEISELQKHIGAYSKTRKIYAQYRRLPLKRQEAFYAERAGAIISCEAAKRYFDSLGLKKLPSIQSLKQEYVSLSAENKKTVSRTEKSKGGDDGTAHRRHNTERILGLPEDDRQ